MEKIVHTISRNNYNTNLINNLIHIYKIQNKQLPDAFFVEAKEDKGIIDKTVFSEGDLVMGVKKYSQNSNFFLDRENLYLVNTTLDGGEYTIDENGDLLYSLTID